MTEAAIHLPRTDAPSPPHIRFRSRLLIYFGLWILAAVGIQIFLQPESGIETHLTPLQQRLIWPLHTPLMVVIGLAQAVTWPDFPKASAVFAAGGGLILHAALSLACTRRSWWQALAVAEVLLLATAVIYFVRQSQLPSGG